MLNSNNIASLFLIYVRITMKCGVVSLQRPVKYPQLPAYLIGYRMRPSYGVYTMINHSERHKHFTCITFFFLSQCIYTLGCISQEAMHLVKCIIHTFYNDIYSSGFRVPASVVARYNLYV